jgi:hypothetical protein
MKTLSPISTIPTAKSATLIAVKKLTFPRHYGDGYAILQCLYQHGPMTVSDVAAKCKVKNRAVRDTMRRHDIPDIGGKRELPRYMCKFFESEDALGAQKSECRERAFPSKVKRPTMRHASAMSWFVETSV